MLTDDVPANVQETAETFREQAFAAWAAIRNDTTLTPDAIRAAMAKVAVDLYAKLDGLQNSSNGLTAARKEDALRRAFGSPSANPTAAISARDASDRAAALGPDDYGQALDLLGRADLNYDEVLAAALGYRAFEMINGGPGGFGYGSGGWAEVLDQYLQARPQAAAALAELSATQVRPNIAALAAFWVPLPPELTGLDRWQIQAMAAS